MAAAVHITRLDEIAIISFENKPVFTYHGQLISFLKVRLGEEYAAIFSNPFITEKAILGKEDARWSSTNVSEKSVPLSDRSQFEQNHYRSILANSLDPIQQLAIELQESKNQSDEKFGKLLELAIIVPSEEFIYTENDQIVLMAWGFRLRKKTTYTSIRRKIPTPASPSIPSTEPLLPNKPRLIVPIHANELGEDANTGRKIVLNRLNVVLTGVNKNINEFAISFKKLYPDPSYQIIYYDDITCRIQIKIPASERERIQSELPSALPQFNILIIPESSWDIVREGAKTTLKKKWHHQLIHTNSAWKISTGNPDILVAVIDDGFDLKHKSIAKQVKESHNILSRNDRVTVREHGTHVAGLVVGSGEEEVGVAPNCSLLPIQVMDSDGNMTTTAIVDSILFALDKGAHVINLSLGENIPQKYLKLPLNEQKDYAKHLFKDDAIFWDQVFSIAGQQNSIIVLAAGNDNAFIGMDAKTRSSQAIKVTAITSDKKKAPFSNHGELATISAPGVSIYSSLPGNRFGTMDGTSMAAPIVAGSIALMKSKNPDLSLQEAVQKLHSTAIDPIQEPDKPIGKIIQLGAAMGFKESVGPISPITNDTPTPPVNPPDAATPPPGNPGFFDRLWGNRAGCLRSILYFILFLLVIALLVSIIRSCGSPIQRTYLPPEPGYIPPIDTTKIVPAPDSIRTIISNRLNIAMKDEKTDLNEFSRAFKKAYPGNEFKIVYYDDLVKRVQIEVPSDRREMVLKEIKSTLPDFEMLIWEESLFERKGIPSDPMMQNDRQSWYLKVIKAFDAWDVTYGDPEVVIAVIDSGFDLEHPELAGKAYRPYNPFSKNSDVTPNSPFTMGYDHGTHVAGTAIARANNDLGIAGIAPNCKLMPIKVADQHGNIPSSAIIDGLLYAIYQGADVINVSLGMISNPRIASFPLPVQEQISDTIFHEEGQFWEELFEIAYERNIVIVQAAGNEDIYAGIDPMKRSSKTITVSAVDVNLERASFSNFGDNSSISAPGVEIYSSIPGGRYGYEQGTSMASPIIAGAVGLVKSVNPVMSFDEILRLMQNTGLPVSAKNGKEIGKLIQLNRLLNAVEIDRRKQPRVDCPEMQAQIDSLLYEIEKIRRACESMEADTMSIPESARDLSFANGSWKSTSPISNVNTDEPVTLYFNFDVDGTNEIRLTHENGIVCNAAISLSLIENGFSVDQEENAICQEGREYSPYQFACEADRKGKAVCEASNKDSTRNQFKFNLIRVR